MDSVAWVPHMELVVAVLWERQTMMNKRTTTMNGVEKDVVVRQQLLPVLFLGVSVRLVALVAVVMDASITEPP